MSLIKTSKFVAYVLRHKPEAIGISLDEHGWARVDQLISGIAQTRYFTMEILEEIVEKDSKMRFSFNNDKTLIRANQGHTIPVCVDLEEKCPPMFLLHGTAEKYKKSIEEQGLIPKSRLYVHLSDDYKSALEVGKRHGTPIVYRVNSDQMNKDGFSFYLSANEVWLTKHVPVDYLEIIHETLSLRPFEVFVRFHHPWLP